ncbi:uncharacterized protein LOC133517254 isoform X3 [Cydia pomonella]|uniref:uncharacterized protein LOC133517254 isoform X3 n=1 Tax=Cydia pomonella TaxID=82600 RepID=UPI002ADE2AFE|nr:uncharacterized protein LOC133517254 isoform X3 [Cydia pomonella]
MAKEAPRALKFDPNTEAFQMRAQWKKQDMCRKQWFKRWAWLLDERIQAQAEAEAAKKEVQAALPHVASKEETIKTLKPVPVTSTGIIGWLAAKFVIMIYLARLPVRNLHFVALETPSEAS